MGMEPIRYETRRTSVCAAHDHSGEGEFAAFYRASGPDFYWNPIPGTTGGLKSRFQGKRMSAIYTATEGVRYG